MNIFCDYKDCRAAATHVVFIKTGCLTLCDHHTRSLRHAPATPARSDFGAELQLGRATSAGNRSD
jgi:hypothetical protein